MTDVVELFSSNPALGVIAVLLGVLAYFFNENKKNKETRINELDTQLKVIVDEGVKIRDSFISMRHDTLKIKDDLKNEMTAVVQDVYTLKTDLKILTNKFEGNVSKFSEEYTEARNLADRLDRASNGLAEHERDLISIKKILLNFRREIENLKTRAQK